MIRPDRLSLLPAATVALAGLGTALIALGRYLRLLDTTAGPED